MSASPLTVAHLEQEVGKIAAAQRESSVTISAHGALLEQLDYRVENLEERQEDLISELANIKEASEAVRAVNKATLLEKIKFVGYLVVSILAADSSREVWNAILEFFK
jgi:phosphopantetheine adenylyltransferase